MSGTDDSYFEYTSPEEKTIARLTAERDAANQRAAASLEAVARANAERDAMVAAAYEAAGNRIDDVFANSPCYITVRDLRGDCAPSSFIRKIIPAHATAALDRIKAEARADGLRQAAAACDKVRANAVEFNLPQMSLGAAECRDTIRLLALIPASPPADPAQVTERYQHIKRGGFYTVIARGKLQTETPLTDYAELVAYRCEETGEVWFRPQSEFTPDRFRAIAGDWNE